MSTPSEIPEGITLEHYGEETLILERVNDVISASLEPVHIYSISNGIAFTGLRHAANYLGLHPNTVAKYLDAGVLKHVTLPSKNRRVRVDSLKELYAIIYKEPEPLASNTEGYDYPETPMSFEEPHTGQAIAYLGSTASHNTIELPDLNYQISREGYLGIPLKELEDLIPASEEVVLWVRPIDGHKPVNQSKAPDENSKLEEIKINFADGAVIIDMGARELVIDGDAVHLANREFSVLQYLAENKGIAVTRQQILDAVWGNWFSSDKVVDVNLSVIRRRLGDYKYLLRTLRGYGYKFDDFPPPSDT